MPLTPDEVVARTFQPTKFREGYDQAEVDDFLDEVVAELRRLHGENDELRSKLATCEKRSAELSRSASGSAPQQTERGTVAAVARPSLADERPRRAAARTASPAVDIEKVPDTEKRFGAAAASAVSTAGGPAGGVQEAAGMLALAQRLHDEHVRTGERERDRLIGEAKSHADRLVSDAERQKTDTLITLERERSSLEREIDELKVFEREYRSRLKSYLESQMRDLDNQSSVIPGRPPHEVATTGS